MSEDKDKNRWRYLLATTLITNLLNQHLITHKEFEEIDKKNIKTFLVS